ncbi:MAG TPA: response regulator [Verrucomicrobiae bacterium]|jgi:CheY-like chemotaxis protein
MEKRTKILLLDDDTDWLTFCRELLASSLPSKPEVLTANTARRALTLLETEEIRLLICDLKMPRIDGLQMLTIVRRRFPELSTVVLSGMEDEEFRSRSYALGVDLFWLKSEMQRNGKLFYECLESLLGRETGIGFRGIQSKGLMDIIQMECLSRSSTVLRITHGPSVAKVWLQDGELMDAELDGARGEIAFLRLLAWKGGTFENLPAEPAHPRTIMKPVNALLLESAQSLDENQNPSGPDAIEAQSHRKTIWKLAQLTREGADFVISVPTEGQGEPEGIGTQNITQLAHFTKRANEIARRLGERVEAGPLLHFSAQSSERQALLLSRGDRAFLVGWPSDAEGNLPEKSRKLVASWD